jgi:DeoR/GlpR family transcriptional regulator of sugar metabolism
VGALLHEFVQQFILHEFVQECQLFLNTYLRVTLNMRDNVQIPRSRLRGHVPLHARQEQILHRLKSSNYAEVKELAAVLDVDASTIRRDLQSLVRSGNVERVHGGVRLPPVAFKEPSREFPQSKAHIGIAASARTFLERGGSVVLGGGPISERLSMMLFDIPNLTVHTNAPGIAEVLSRNGVQVYLAGGEIRPGDNETSGSITASYFEQTKADWVFLECDGVHPYSGFTAASPWHVVARRAMIAAADRRCVMAPSVLFGARHVGFIADVATADLIITDEALADGELPAFAGRVVRAPTDPLDDWRVDPATYGF